LNNEGSNPEFDLTRRKNEMIVFVDIFFVLFFKNKLN